jgi:ribonuclease P/MRP protein subunit POP1
VDVVDFAGARAAELRALRTAAAATSGNRRVYQSLSWHQRRRTMSHTSHRMPARLRVAHRRELALCAAPGTAMADDGRGIVERPPGPQGKMRCRKYRRKAAFLLAIRRLRAQGPRWLETHIWHAKRFLMDTVAGGRTVAIAPNDRGLRSGYRAVAHASLAHDASYLDVIEVTAPTRAAVAAALTACMSPEDAARCTVDPVQAGTRRVERVVVVNAAGDALAPVNLLWRPHESQVAQLWLWCHPAGSAAVTAALEAVGDVGAVVLDASSGLLTFSLIGPRSGAVLNAVLHRVRNGRAEWEAVRHVRSAASLPQGCVLVMDVEDPRASFPPKRCGEGGRVTTATETSLLDALENGFRTVQDSPLWCADLRAAAVARARHTDGTPWADVPVICLQRASSTVDRGGGGEFASGWDLLVPAGWGMAFWMSLMYANGARAAGQRELRHMALETGVPVFPEDYQDAAAGSAAMKATEERAQERFNRRPKAKRVNYVKYRVASPFRVDLDALVAAGGDVAPNAPAVAESVAIANKRRASKRPRRQLVASSEAGGGERPVACAATASCHPRPRILRSELEIRRMLQLPSATAPRPTLRARWAPATIGPPVPGQPQALVRVLLRPTSRGVPRRNAIIALPGSGDDVAAAHDSGAPVEPRGHSSNSQSTRRVVGQVVHGDYVLGKGRAVASGVATVAGVRAAPAVETGGARKGRDRAGLWEVHVLFRNIDSLQYRWAVASVVPG